NKEWFKALQSTSDDWYWCIASPCVFTSMDLLHLMLETTVPRETWPDVLKLLLQRTDVQALTFQVPQDVETSVVGLFDSIATMNQFEGQHPGSFEALKWIVLDMDAPEKWDALLQFNKKFRLDYRPVGLISHQKVNMGKPKHQQRHHAADDDMPSTRFVHVVASLPSSSSSSSSTRGIGDPTHAVHTLAHLPQTVQPNRLMLHPSSSHAFGHAFRRTLLRLVSIPFSTTIGDFLQLVPLEPTSKNVISIVVWRLLCGLTFFHAALLTRQRTVVGHGVDVATIDLTDLVLAVYVITGPLLVTITNAFLHCDDGGDPLDLLEWPYIQDAFMVYAYARKCTSVRGDAIVRGMLRECIGPYLVVPNMPPLASRFHLPLPTFQDMLKTPSQSTDDYLAILSAFSSTCKWVIPDAVFPDPLLRVDIRDVLLHRRAQSSMARDDVVALATAVCLPPPMTLKLHPRNALATHHLRSFLKTVVHFWHDAREHTAAFWVDLIDQVRELDPALAVIPTESLRHDVVAILKDQVPPRAAPWTPAALDMTLSESLSYWQASGRFLQLWWDEGQTEYWCPGILFIEDFITAFLLAYCTQSNTPLNCLEAVADVYATADPIAEPFRNRKDTILLTGLKLMNATPTDDRAIRNAPGEVGQVNVLLRAVEAFPGETMVCPVLGSTKQTQPLGHIRVQITPTLSEWTTCPFLVLTPSLHSPVIS
ncbi:hypothetical protein As57867_014631, partial [Aphanomyces stellatus]